MVLLKQFILGLLSIVLLAFNVHCKNKDFVETSKAIENTQNKAAKDSLLSYQILVTEAKASTDELPLKDISLKMPNEQVLFLTQLNSVKEIPNKDLSNYGIPEKAIFALRSFYAGAGEYCYGIATKNTVKVYRRFFDEDGSTSDAELIKQFELQQKQWVEIRLETIETADDYRNKHWKPEKGKYYFSEEYVYNYTSEFYPPDDKRHSGTFSFYLDKKTGTILLTRYQSYTDEMLKYILIRPKHDYIIAYTTEHSKTVVDTIQQDAYIKTYFEQYKKDATDNFKQYYSPVANLKKTYGNSSAYCLDSLKAETYKVAMKDNSVVTVALAKVPFDITNLYHLQKTEAYPEGGLLVPLGRQNLPGNLLLVEENARVNGKNIQFSLDCISATSYFVDLFNP